MARRNSSNSPADAEVAPETTDTEATTEAVNDEPTESTAEVAPESTDEVATEATTESTEPDLSDFKAAVERALELKDESDGAVNDAEALKAVNEAYRQIDGIKGKNAARTYLEDEMRAAIMPPRKDILSARAYVSLKENLSAAGGSSTPKAPADPTTAFVQKIAALSLANGLAAASVPEGVDEGWADKVDELVDSLNDQVQAFQAWQASEDEDAEQPEVSPVVRQAFKLAAGKASGGGGTRITGGPRRDIEKHLIQVFESLEPGSFLTVNEIAKAQSTEYGDDRPSAGAVSARLFPKDRQPYNANGIEAVAEEGKSRGAVKVA